MDKPKKTRCPKCGKEGNLFNWEVKSRLPGKTTEDSSEYLEIYLGGTQCIAVIWHPNTNILTFCSILESTNYLLKFQLPSIFEAENMVMFFVKANSLSIGSLYMKHTC